MSTVNCASCANFEPGDNTCHVNPPQIFSSGQQVGAWPVVQPNSDWCAKHEDGAMRRGVRHDINARKPTPSK
jgi:hypothetical protein